MRYALVSSVTLFSTFATAPVSAEEEPARWGLGLASVVSVDPYAGKGTRYVPVPLITYDGELFFFREIGGGIHLFDNDLLELNLIVQGDLAGVDADDFGRRELARNGIDRDLLEDRADTIDAGLQLGLEGAFGEIELAVVSDVLEASDGYKATAEYGYPIEMGQRLTLTPTLGVEWLSRANADYYYGTLDAEVARGVVRYRPGSVVIPEVGLGLEYVFAGSWMLLGDAAYQILPDRIADSPLLDTDGSARLMLAVSHVF